MFVCSQPTRKKSRLPSCCCCQLSAKSFIILIICWSFNFKMIFKYDHFLVFSSRKLHFFIDSPICSYILQPPSHNDYDYFISHPSLPLGRSSCWLFRQDWEYKLLWNICVWRERKRTSYHYHNLKSTIYPKNKIIYSLFLWIHCTCSLRPPCISSTKTWAQTSTTTTALSTYYVYKL